ncbi:methyltransferase of ATP-grasp peptide maturase system [Tamaricihabitans halophyticus]|uniref:Protein-L-isoaspartate O-methyltransferase n=1 Tax=Tamaricihabitans halophyticus TaxID=1262583 RepID=A0A4R2RBF7_9PSEU|nr:methyltransferase domain-containing protein [Tamaricihabitans halophyticus]TCP57051.1 methyltransferase of ATP-grasp peptide maturase system [Tamaricihabitans halophyticus]
MNHARSVVIMTHRFDPTADRVVEKLNEREANLFRFDAGDFPEQLMVSAELADEQWEGSLRTARRSVELSRISGIYYRRPTSFQFHPDMSENEQRWAAVQARMGFGGLLSALRPWLNHPHRIGLAEYKPAQLCYARDVGLRVPRTLVTNDADKARNFVAELGRAVCKPFGGAGITDSDGTRQVYATLVVPEQCVDQNIARTMHLFQEWVPKVHEVRLTVVADQFFATRIDSGSPESYLDWRADYDSLTYSIVQTPSSIRSAVGKLLRRLASGSPPWISWFHPAVSGGSWNAIPMGSGHGSRMKPECRSPAPSPTHWKGPPAVLESPQLQSEFVHDLVDSGALTDPGWIAAFTEVPRAAFVPYFFDQQAGIPDWFLVEAESAEWAAGVYSRRALITQLDGDTGKASQARQNGRVDGIPTSSSSSPTLMASMLESLDVHDGHTVLEIGVGTGYNAGLLAHRLGADNVTSLDVDAALVSLARTRLDVLGYRPHLEAADGAKGCAARGPFDRVLATVGFDRIPAEWIEQTKPGGKILVPVDRHGTGGLLALLTVTEDGKAQRKRAQGGFLPGTGFFMPVRANQGATPSRVPSVDLDKLASRRTELPADLATSPRESFQFFGALLVGGFSWVQFTPRDGAPTETWLTQPSGAWVCHRTDPDGIHQVYQGGPRRLWDELESSYQEWVRLGRPQRQRFGLTVDGTEHTLWLDQPAGAHQWSLVPGSTPEHR